MKKIKNLRIFNFLASILFTLLGLLLNANVCSANTGCSAYVGTCQYYQCLETKQQCGQDGYYLSFGKKYCEKYESKEKKFSAKGQLFLQNVRTCLQVELEKTQVLPTCQDIKRYAIETHKTCYKKSNFCGLSGFEKLRVEYYARAQVTDPDFLNFAIYLHKMCADK